MKGRGLDGAEIMWAADNGDTPVGSVPWGHDAPNSQIRCVCNDGSVIMPSTPDGGANRRRGPHGLRGMDRVAASTVE